MNLKILDEEYVVVQLFSLDDINFNDDCLFLGKTDEEISLVCKKESIPSNYKQIQKYFKAIKIDGVLDFSLIGILSKISTVLANNNIGIFVVSTYNTDYILVNTLKIDKVIECLKENGYNFL